jgi:hypothetical protein
MIRKILARSLIAVLLLTPVSLLLSEPVGTPITVSVPTGMFIFEKVTLFQRSEILKRDIPHFEVRLTNHTSRDWTRVVFHIVVKGQSTDADSKPVEETMDLTVPAIYSGETQEFTRYFIYREFTPSDIQITFKGGEDHPNAEQREAMARAQKARVDAKRRKELADKKAAADARLAYLAKFPILQNGSPVAFIGSDRKCSAQFVEAAAMEGLEKRKRIADLIVYGCGFTVDTGTHVSVTQKDGAYALVKVIEGGHDGKSGWVPISWLK